MAIEELYIAEKPSVGKAIAENLGGTVEPVRGDNGRPTHYIVGNKVVTWVFGHILELAEPEDYNDGFKGDWVNGAPLLPLVPSTWQLKPVPTASDQLAVIKALLKEAKVVVHAGDPDREGQLLVTEVLDYLGNSAPVLRILPNAIDDKSMRKILAAKVDDSQFAGLYQAGLGRQRADWLIGMNMSRACTISNQRSGMRGTLSVGRVQTPTLALVVRRDLEIENFKPQAYYALTGQFRHANGNYSGKWVPPKGLAGIDSEGRVLDDKLAASIKQACDGQAGSITEYKVEDSKQSPPLPYSLSSLQKKASQLYKMSAKKVLDICQSLYEKKVTTYPRTDCQYLPQDQFGEAGAVLSAISKFDPTLAKAVAGSDAALQSPAWNSKKVTAHHAIAPTAEANYATLTDPERRIFALIAKQFVAQFYPDYRFKQTLVVTQCGGQSFRSSGRTPYDLGWRKIFAAEEAAERSSDVQEGAEAEDNQLLPQMRRADPVNCAKLSAQKKQTKAPARFTEGTLIHAMTNVHETVADPAIKKKLQEVKGIGTEATRSEIIETLKQRLFVSADVEPGKIISTPAGRAFIAALPPDLTNVALTALWESALDHIEHKGMTLERFLDGQTQWIKKLTRQALDTKISIGVGMSEAVVKNATAAGAGAACPKCKKGTLQVREAKKGANAGYMFLSCSAFPECDHTADIDGQDDPSARGSAGGKRRGGGKDGGSSGGKRK